ncbi:MAG: histidine kinase [Thaumarchaeota archaeon]|nr:histidine kinase [Nitrososphaerota archaeon]
MVFLRSKIVKNESYSYLVKSKWNSKKKTSQQETIKYLGKTSDVELEDIPDEYRNDPSILSFLSSNSKIDDTKRGKYLTKTRKNMRKFLLAGDLKNAMAIYDDFLNQSSITKFYDDILRPAMYKVGELWDEGKLDVGDEHIASNTAMHLIEKIGTKPKSKSRGKTILICTPDGEYHAIPCFMMETYFSLNGYDVINLAPSAPSDSIIKHITEKKPDLILISVTLKDHLKSCGRLIKNLQKFKVPIVIGGQALQNEKSFRDVTVMDTPSLFELSKTIKVMIKKQDT